MDTKKGDTYYRLRFSEILSKEKLLSNVDLFKIMQTQREGNLESLGQIAVKKNILTEEQLSDVYKKYFNISYVSLENRKIPEEIAYLIPVVLLRKYLIFPLQFTSSEKLAVAMVNPLDVQAIKHLEVLTHHSIKPLYSSESEILKKIEQFFENNQEETAASQEDRLEAFNPEEAINFFKAQKQKESAPVAKQKTPTPPITEPLSISQDDDEIIDVQPIANAPQVKANTAPGATTFWGDTKSKLEPMVSSKPPEAPVPSSPLPIKALHLDQTSKIKVVGADQPSQNRVPPLMDLRKTSVPTPTKKLKPMMTQETEKKQEENSPARTYKLKRMPTNSPTENIALNELKSQKKREETNHLSKEATQKLAELTEQIQEELKPQKNTILNATHRTPLVRRKLRQVDRSHLFAPVPVAVVSLSAIEFYKRSEATPKSFIEEKIRGWRNPQEIISPEMLTPEEFYLLEN